jgi:hypothetical protein
MAHFKTAVLSDDDCLGIRDLRGHLGNYRLLFIEIESQGQLLLLSAFRREIATSGKYGDLHSGIRPSSNRYPVFG